MSAPHPHAAESASPGITATVGESPGLDAAAALAGQVAHDLGNMLTTLLGSAELLAEQLESQPDLAAILARMIRAAERGRLMADRLELFSRAVPLADPPVEAAPLLAAEAARIAAGLPAGIALQIEIPAAAGRITLAPAALARALDELVRNATAAMQDGGTLRLRVGHVPTEAMLRIEVADEGPGLTAETLRRAAGLGFAAGSAAHRTALGLAIAVRITAAAGGRLALSASPGGGMRATLEIPLS